VAEVNEYLTILEQAWQDHLKPKPDNAPTVISTFAGCGGSSLGYSMAGFRELLAIEWDDNAVATFELNFPDVPVYHGDIAKISVEQVLEMTGLQPGELDVFDGSPPCQGFSTAGKRVMDDPRNQLFREYVRLLRGLRPKVFVMENVSGMVKGKMKLVFREIMLALKATGYTVRCKLLNAMYYEVPQSRERLIWIGVRGDIGNEPGFPEPVGKPVTVAQALSNVNVQDGPAPTLSALAKSRYAETKRGSRHTQRFSTVRLNWDSVCPTIVKERGSGGLFHPDEPRLLSVGELKRIASFPDSWKFVGTYDNALNRIGNSVPPRFMYHIAKHIRDHILRLANGREPVA